MLNPFIICAFSVVITLANCSPKPVHTCGLADFYTKPGIDSKALQLERVAIADTTIAYISGSVFGKDSSDTRVTTDTLIYAVVVAKDSFTGQSYGAATVKKENIRLPCHLLPTI